VCEKVIQHGWGWKAVRFASLPVAEKFSFFLFPLFSFFFKRRRKTDLFFGDEPET